jgi:palmitoyltransferase ZDHHC9/14/18
MFGPDIRSLVITILLIVAPVALFCIFVVRHLLHKFPGYDSGYAILVVAIVYTFYVSISDLLAYCSLKYIDIIC